MKIKKGDTVLITSGKDKAKVAKVLRSFPKEGRILVEGANLKKKHVRPKNQGEKGQIVSSPSPMNVSSVKFLCPKCGKATRIGYKIVMASPDPAKREKRKVRICKKCQSEV